MLAAYTTPALLPAHLPDAKIHFRVTQKPQPALLALANGDLFHGVAIGAEGFTVGEVVFNTAMTGYQEILTDPSYRKQLVTLTYPHVGNVGVNPEDVESSSIQAAGLILREAPRAPSSWRSKQSLPDYLNENGVIGIAEIDTRQLTRILREQGAQSGCIMTAAQGEDIDADKALALAREFPGLKGMDLAAEAGTQSVYEWTEPTWVGPDDADDTKREARFHLAVYDYGAKRNILRSLVDAGCKLTVVPPRTPLADVLALNVDGVVLSSGPGDPDPCDYAIAAAKELLERNVPTLGICLGHQILSLAVGGKSLKMKFGHHGANHPVTDTATGTVMISSQNHGFAIDEDSLPAGVRASYRSLFDGSLQGIEVEGKPVITFQGHPEASPGPHDVSPLFARFIKIMETGRA